MRLKRPVVLLLSLLLFAGCKPDVAVKKAETFGSGTVPNTPAPGGASASAGESAAPAGPTGNVSGTIVFEGKAPARVAIDTTMDPACNLGKHQVTTEQYVVNAGKLANVFVYVKQQPGTVLAVVGQVPAPTVLDQQGCQYVPHVVSVMAGGYV